MIMKNLKYIFAAMALVAAASGCNKEQKAQEGNFPADGVVRVNTTVAAPLTKAGTSDYEGETLGLYIDYGTGDRFTASNVLWSKDVNGKWTASELMLWKNAQDRAAVYAYAPYTTAVVGEKIISFDIPADQTAGIDAADFVCFADDDFAPYTDLDWASAIAVNFSHALVKLTVNITKGNQFDGVDMPVKSVTIKRTAGTVNCDLAAFNAVSVPTDAASVDVIMHKAGDNCYEGIFFPGLGQKPGEEAIIVTMEDGTSHSYVVPAAGISFEGGYAYTMNLKVGKDKLTLARNVSVNNWNEPEEIPGGEAERI